MAIQFTLPTSGSDPVVTSKGQLEQAVQAVVDQLSGRDGEIEAKIDTVAVGLSPIASWDANSGAFPANSVFRTFYAVNNGGVVDGVAFAVGDWLVPLVSNASTTDFSDWIAIRYSQTANQISGRAFAGISEAQNAVGLADGQLIAVAGKGFRYTGEVSYSADGETVFNIGGGQAVLSYSSGFTTRTGFVEALSRGARFTPGDVVHAEGVAYQRVATGGSIPDLPGWVPAGDLRAEHFGVSPWNDRAVNDAAMPALIAYSASKKQTIRFGPFSYQFSAPWTLTELASVAGDKEYGTILDFQDCNGIMSEVGATLNSYGVIRDVTVRGNAHTSTSSSATQGVRISKANYWRVSNVTVENFVHNWTLTGDDGFIQGFEMGVRSFATRYPNAVNGYPNTLFRILGDAGGKPQVGSVTGIIYGQLMTHQTDITATSGQTDFVIDWGATKDLDLYKETGLRVGIESAWGVFIPQSIGSDYDLFCVWNGTEYQIPVGTEYVRDYVRAQSGNQAARATRFIVRFRSGQASGAKVRLQWNDPTARFGIYNLVGTGWKFDVQLGGAETGIYAGSPDNEYRVRYAQMCGTLFRTTQEGDDNRFDLIEYQGGTINKLLTNEKARTYWLGRMGRTIGRASADVTNSTQTAAQVIPPIKHTCRPPVPRMVTATAQYTVSTTAGNTARAEITLERKMEGASATSEWVTIGGAIVQGAEGGASTVTSSGVATIRELDTLIDQGNLGRLAAAQYRLMSRGLNGATTITLEGGTGPYESSIWVEDVQPE